MTIVTWTKLATSWINGGDDSKKPEVSKGTNGHYKIIADGDTDADGSLRFKQIDPSSGQGETSLRKSNGWQGSGANCDAEYIPYFVLPLNWRTVTGDTKTSLGDIAKLSYEKNTVYAIYGDEGPIKIIGEASICAIEALGGIPWNESKTQIVSGIDHGVSYEIIPGSKNLTRTIDFNSIQEYGKELFGEESKPAKVPTQRVIFAKLGDTGANVKALQHLLNLFLIVPLVVDGDFGPKTEAAIKSMQTKLNQKIDGIVDQVFWELLQKSEPKPPVTANQALLDEAHKWIGTHEEGGNNKGATVEMFQKAVDGVASGESWCMAFLQYCIKQVEERLGIKSKIFRTEHCLTCWNSSPVSTKEIHPQPGYIVIWQHGSTSNGHTGIITAVQANGNLSTIEGNTNLAGSTDGDGVFAKTRNINGEGDMHIVGYLNPF